MIDKLHTVVKLEAAHRVPNHEGKCKYLHGHSWKVYIDVEGGVCQDDKDPSYGMVIDFSKVKDVVFQYDHDYFNEPQRGQTKIENPTAENLAEHFATLINDLSPRISSVRVRVEETTDSWAEVEIP